MHLHVLKCLCTLMTFWLKADAALSLWVYISRIKKTTDRLRYSADQSSARLRQPVWQSCTGQRQPVRHCSCPQAARRASRCQVVATPGQQQVQLQSLQATRATATCDCCSLQARLFAAAARLWLLQEASPAQSATLSMCQPGRASLPLLMPAPSREYATRAGDRL